MNSRTNHREQGRKQIVVYHVLFTDMCAITGRMTHNLISQSDNLHITKIQERMMRRTGDWLHTLVILVIKYTRSLELATISNN